MRAVLASCVILFGCSVANSAEPPLTVAEKTEFKSTSRYADVTSICDELAKRPNVRVSTFGTSHEGRTLPLLTIADPPVSSPEGAAKSGKLVVLAFANIHAGEVDGKEALLALARELSAEKGHPLLKDLVILLVPILNADGNEKIDVKNRPEQNGPANGVGIRENAQGLDLNRDFIKLETPEVRALVKLFNTWDPSVIIDCHTTNGSKHRYTLTYDGPRYPSTDGPLPEWVNNAMLPEAGKRVKAATGFDTAPYGNFNREKTKWETYPALPRYSIQYIALRNRIGILSESYSYASFKDRVTASGAFVKACFEIAAEKKADVKRVISEPPKTVVLRTETVAFEKKRTILGFDGEQHKDFELEDIARVRPKLVVAKPEVGYVIPPKPAIAIETLRRHGIQVQELREDIDLAVDAQQVFAIDTESKPFQKHLMVSVEVKSRPATKRVVAGSVLVSASQPLGSLAAYLLEPSAEDSLTTWGLFTDALPAPGNDFPVLRLNKAVPLNLGPIAALPEDKPKEKKPITDAMLFSGGAFGLGFSGRPTPSPTWLPDGEHFLQVKDGKLWKVKARTGEAELFVSPEKLKQSLAAYKEQADAASKRLPTRMNPDRTGMLLDIGGELVLAKFDGTPAVKLAKSDASREHLTFAPKGNRLAFVRGSNLFMLTESGEQQLTTDGGGEIQNAKGDWVYEEEIFNRAGQAYWWSPDGTKIAFLRFDDAPVKKFNIVDLRGALETWRYPKSGDANPLVSLHVADMLEGKSMKLDLGMKPEDTVISRVGWMPDSKSPFAYAQNRTQTWLDFTVWEGGKPKALFRDTTKAWIEDAGPPHFLPDGSFLFPSDRSGYRHLYIYSADGKLQKAVTTGEWEVRDVLRVDAETKDVLFTGTADGHIRTHLYRVNPDREGILRLTEAKGSHQVSVAPKGPLYVDRATDHETPTQVHLCEWIDDPRKNVHTSLFPRVRTLDANPVPQRNEYRFGKFEAVQVPMPDGFKLEGTLIYPPDFDPKKKYPVWLFTYAGPHMPSVREGFGGGRILDQALAASGIVVFRVDPRSASGESAQAAWAAYKQLGVQELKDLEAAVAWLGKNEWMDSTRVGISGHSYGGFMAGYALTHSKVFSAGIASSGVMDWRLYDTIYTERYMLTPKENPDGYDKSSVVKAAKNLHGKLLILHGMMDDNVHVQNSVQLIDALQAAGKPFEMMFYPRSRHGIASPHYLKLELEFIRRTLGVK